MLHHRLKERRAPAWAVWALLLFVVATIVQGDGVHAAATTTFYPEGTNLDITEDTPANNDLGVAALSGSPPTGLIRLNGAGTASFFGTFEAANCAAATAATYNTLPPPSAFAPEDGEVYFVRDGTRYGKVRIDGTTDNSGMTLTWETLGACAVDPPPDSSFTYTTFDQVAFFTDTSTNSPNSWSWDFNSTGTSTQQNPRHYFPTDGTHTVTLTASNAGGTDATPAMQDVMLTQHPNSATENVGAGFDFDGDSTDDISVLAPGGCGANARLGGAGGTWEFAGGNFQTFAEGDLPGTIDGTGAFCPSTGVNGLSDFFVVESSNGNFYKVWAAEVSASHYRLVAIQLNVASGPPPESSFSFTTYDQIAFFTDTSTNTPTGWSWDFDGTGTSGQQNPIHFFPTATTFTVSLTASNIGGGADPTPAMQDVTLTQDPSSATESVGSGFDFDGDGDDDISVLAPGGCAANARLEPANGAAWESAGGDYRTFAEGDLPGAIDGASAFCPQTGFSGLFDFFVVQTSSGDIYKVWAPEVSGTQYRLISELLQSVEADISVTKTDSPDPVLAGGNITYTISFSNNGPNSAADVTVTDTVPTGTTFISASTTSGADWTVSDPGIGGTGDVTFSKTTVIDDETATFEIVVQVDAGATNGTTISNTAAAATSTTDPTAGNDSSTVQTTVSAEADLSIMKTDSPDPVPAGEEITYTIDVENNGPIAADNVLVTDTVPAGTTFVSATAPAGWTPTTPAVGSGGNVTFESATMAVGATASFTMVVRVDEGQVGAVTNTATVGSSTVDSLPGNNTASASTTIDRPTDLSITKSASAALAIPGSEVVYALTVDNGGDIDAAGVTIIDVLPAGVTYVSDACGGSAAGQEFTWAVGSLAAGASAACEVTVTMPDSLGKVTNTATVDSANQETDPGNNTASATVEVVDPDLAASADGPDVAPPGAPVTYLVEVRNAGQGAAIAVTLTAAISGGSISGFETPPGVTCSASTCDLGDLPPGASVTLWVHTVAGETTGTTGMLLETCASTVTLEMNTANNCATAGTSIIANAIIPPLPSVGPGLYQPPPAEPTSSPTPTPTPVPGDTATPTPGEPGATPTETPGADETPEPTQPPASTPAGEESPSATPDSGTGPGGATPSPTSTATPTRDAPNPPDSGNGGLGRESTPAPGLMAIGLGLLLAGAASTMVRRLRSRRSAG